MALVSSWSRSFLSPISSFEVRLSVRFPLLFVSFSRVTSIKIRDGAQLAIDAISSTTRSAWLTVRLSAGEQGKSCIPITHVESAFSFALTIASLNCFIVTIS
ncbi:Uncharacterised protein [Chlamydia trachomatis]|nr:Uncharacterised protein [Chlamydia trachomatis]